MAVSVGVAVAVGVWVTVGVGVSVGVEVGVDVGVGVYVGRTNCTASAGRLVTAALSELAMLYWTPAGPSPRRMTPKFVSGFATH